MTTPVPVAPAGAPGVTTAGDGPSAAPPSARSAAPTEVARSAGWVAAGNALLLSALAGLTDDQLTAPSALPGWSRRFLLAHVAANADAVLRLLTWARTGVRTPMYASPEQRAADIESGAALPAGELRAWVARGMEAFAAAVADLDAAAWAAEVVTGQGRVIPAARVPWLRARESCIHAVDFAAGVGFDDLPQAFCAALVTDIGQWRTARGDGPALALESADSAGPGLPASWQVGGEGAPRPVVLPVAELAGWLAGRLHHPELPVLPTWL